MHIFSNVYIILFQCMQYVCIFFTTSKKDSTIRGLQSTLQLSIVVTYFVNYQCRMSKCQKVRLSFPQLMYEQINS